MIYTIYQITNIVTGKTYVGCTSLKKPHYRMAEHMRNAFKINYRGVGGVFYTDIRKFGRNNYSFRTITRVESSEIAKRLEDKFIKDFMNEGLSLNTRMSAGVLSEKARKRRAKSLKKNKNACGKRSLASRRRISEGHARARLAG